MILDLCCYRTKCYLRLGQWQESLQGINEPAVLHYYAPATEHDSTW